MEVGWLFGTKALSDDTATKTQATADSKEGNLFKHNKNKFYRTVVLLDLSVQHLYNNIYNNNIIIKGSTKIIK